MFPAYYSSILLFMIKQNIEKIAKLLKDRSYCVPELFYKYFSFFMYYAQRIDNQSTQFNAVSLFSDIYKLYKAFLIDEPYQLTKLSLTKIDQDIKEHCLDSLTDFSKFRDKFLKQFPQLKPKEPFLQDMHSQVSNLSWTARLRPYLNESLQIKKQLQSKKKVENIRHSEMTILFWYRRFKGDYIVHISTFIQYFHSFARQIFPGISFLNRNSNASLKELCDPERKHFVTIMNCEELFFKLRDPIVIRKLWQDTQQNKEEQLEFQSEHSLTLSLSSASHNTTELIQLSGVTVTQENQTKSVQIKPVVFVGSSVDNDIVIKSKYVSRKQLMIVQDKKPEKSKDKQSQNQYFSIVCLSQTNFTSVKYPKPFKIHVGDIFYCQNIKYQVIKLQKESMEIESQEDERTLTILPTERQSPIKSPLNCEKITFLILSGEDKQKQFSISSQHMLKLTEIDQQHEFRVSKQLIYDQHFYLRPCVRVLVKNANEILENRLSHKVKLVKGLEICLEEYSLIVL